MDFATTSAASAMRDRFDVHPAANLFPMMDNEAYQALKTDIAENGIRDPIVLFGRKLLDGRNRYRACLELNIEPPLAELDDDGSVDPLAYILSANLFRRHLSASQRAQIAVEAETFSDAEAKAQERMQAGRKRGGGDRKSETAQNRSEASLPQSDRGHQARDEVARRFGVSARYVQDAKTIKAADPELAEKVRAGEVSIPEALKAIKNSATSACPNCGATEFDEDGDCLSCREPNVDGDHEPPARPHVAHNSGDNEWYTPPEYIERAVAVMGGIDLDPASSNEANRVVGAARYHTAGDDGLAQDWRGRVFLNPPYAQPLVGRFSDKLVEHVRRGDVPQAVVLVNNATETRWFQTLLSAAAAVCFPAGRVRYWKPDKQTATGLQGQAVIYFGDRPEVFAAEFRTLGSICHVAR